MNAPTKPVSSAAPTDVSDFFAELDGGQFEHKLSIAVSSVAASTVDHDKTGEVTIKLSFTKIPGTHQVHCKHTLSFTRPTLDGTAGEKEERTTPLHVGKFGKLTIAPENQMRMFEAGQP